MIELNLTYEQSEKILKLGYDFSSICRDFELQRNDNIIKSYWAETHMHWEEETLYD